MYLNAIKLKWRKVTYICEQAASWHSSFLLDGPQAMWGLWHREAVSGLNGLFTNQQKGLGYTYQFSCGCCNNLGELAQNNRNLFSHNSGGQTSKIKALEEGPLCPFHSWVAADILWLVALSFNLYSIFTWDFPSPLLCVPIEYLSGFLLKDTCPWL